MELDKPIHSTLLKNYDENKTYILVKLSESFSNAIQEYSAAQNNNSYNNKVKKQFPSKEPTIRFQGTRGAIKFPDGKSYDFSLEQSDNSAECIRQNKTRWESIGRMACCLQVKGKDDVYQMTRTKMKAAEQEKRKYCAKLLGSPEHNSVSKRTKLLSNSNSTKQQAQAQPPPPTPVTNNAVVPTPEVTKPIKDAKQFKKYKADFDKDFQEYQKLHGYLHRIEEKFRKLRELLKKSVEGSPEWESAKEQIFNEYERIKSDSNFHRARREYKQLYNKLGHIKEKIFQFKQRKGKLIERVPRQR